MERMMSKTRVGIDPGQGGAIAIVTDDDIALHDMPTKPRPWQPDKIMVNGPGVLLLLSDIPSDSDITIEAVHSMPSEWTEVKHGIIRRRKQGVASAFAFGGAFHAVVAIVECLGFEPKFVLPAVWKRKCGLIGHGKDVSRQMVLEMHPDLINDLQYKKDNGKSDAFLIAIHEFK